MADRPCVLRQLVSLGVAVAAIGCSANPSSIGELTVTPDGPAAGQMITVQSSRAEVELPGRSTGSASITQGQRTAEAFILIGAGRLMLVRLPFDLDIGPARLSITGPEEYSDAVSVVVSAVPAAPAITAIFPLESQPSAETPCGAGPVLTPVTTVVRSMAVAVAGTGVDTIGATVRFRQGATIVDQPAICGMWSASILEAGRGVSQVVAVPAQLAPGPATIEMRTQINGVDSPFSAPVSISVS
jgi:hypothetical protein